jgi:flagellar M-ring protein FliF
VQVSARSTKNFELDRSVRHTKSAMGTIQKIGVGVLINERPIPPGMKVEKPADGGPAPTTIPYTQEELDRLNQLVRGAVGFSEDRGDVVTVVATRFEPQIDPDAIPWYKDETLSSIANSAVVALLFLLFLLMVVRPMIRKMVRPEVDPAAIAAAAADAAAREAAAAERIKTERIAEAVAEAAAKMAAEKAAAEAAVATTDSAQTASAGGEGGEAEEEIEIQEGETLEEIKARMSSLKPKKPTISADMLNTANTYDDKVALIRMIVSEEAARARVAGVLKNMIQLS